MNRFTLVLALSLASIGAVAASAAPADTTTTTPAVRITMPQTSVNVSVEPVMTQGSFEGVYAETPFEIAATVIPASDTLTASQLSAARLTVTPLAPAPGAAVPVTACIKAADSGAVRATADGLALSLVATYTGKASVKVAIDGVESDSAIVTVSSSRPIVDGTGVITPGKGVNDEGICVLGTQTAENAWVPADFGYTFDVDLLQGSDSLAADDIALTPSAGITNLARTLTLKSAAEGQAGPVYTLDISGTVSQPSDSVAVGIEIGGAPVGSLSFAVVAPDVKIKSITVSATGMADGKIALGGMASADSTAVTYSPSAPMGITAAIELDSISSWPQPGDIVAAVDSANAAGIAPAKFDNITVSNAEGRFTASLGNVTASKTGTSTITVSQYVDTAYIDPDAPAPVVPSGKLAIEAVAPVAKVDSIIVPDEATVVLPESGDSLGVSEIQTAVFKVNTDINVNTVAVKAESSDGIIITEGPTVVLSGGSDGVGTTFDVTVSYKATAPGEQTVTLAAGDMTGLLHVTVTAPKPEKEITVSTPVQLPDSVDVQVEPAVEGQPQSVSVAFNDGSKVSELDLPVNVDAGVDLGTYYEVVYADNNPGGKFINAVLSTVGGKPVLSLSNAPDASLPFSTVITVVDKTTAPASRADEVGTPVIIINAGINAGRIESVIVNGGLPIEIYLGQTLTLTATTEPASTNEVTYVVTDADGNTVEPVAAGQYVFNVAGYYTLTATVQGTVPPVTTTVGIHAINATGDPGQGVSGIEGINADAAEGNAIIYDLSGRRLTRIDAAGIYIVNGVKTLVR